MDLQRRQRARGAWYAIVYNYLQLLTPSAAAGQTGSGNVFVLSTASASALGSSRAGVTELVAQELYQLDRRTLALLHRDGTKVCETCVSRSINQEMNYSRGRCDCGFGRTSRMHSLPKRCAAMR